MDHHFENYEIEYRMLECLVFERLFYRKSKISDSATFVNNPGNHFWKIPVVAPSHCVFIYILKTLTIL